MKTVTLVGNPRPRRGYDTILLAVILIIAVFGLATVYSASSERSNEDYGNPHQMFVNQLFRTFVGFVLFTLTALIPYRFWRKLAYPVLAVSLLLLILVIFGNMGYESHGARRWLTLGPVRFQPSEVAKFAVVLFLAYWVSRPGRKITTIAHGVIYPLVIAMVPITLVALQPDFSTAALIAVIAVALLFNSKVKWEHLAVVIAPLAIAAFAFVWYEPYRRARVLKSFTFHVDPDLASFQVLQSWIGLGRGGIIGVGAGESKQKLFFLPDAHTDFIFSILGEEWGFIGTVILLALFMVLIWRGFRIGLRCKDPFGSHLAVGFTFAIGLYAITNMIVATGIVPTTGLPLPYISYGGTSLLLTYAASGVIFNISRYGRPDRLNSAGGEKT